MWCTPISLLKWVRHWLLFSVHFLTDVDRSRWALLLCWLLTGTLWKRNENVPPIAPHVISTLSLPKPDRGATRTAIKHASSDWLISAARRGFNVTFWRQLLKTQRKYAPVTSQWTYCCYWKCKAVRFSCMILMILLAKILNCCGQNSPFSRKHIDKLHLVIS